MSEIIVEEYKGHTIKIAYDEFAESPREWDNISVMAFFHKRYRLGDEEILFKAEDFNSWEEMKAHIEKVIKPVAILPVYMYDHSGITIATKPFSCRWDSGQIGFVYATKETVREFLGVKRITKKIAERVEELLNSEVKVYDDYLVGRVYSYTVENENGEVLESCGGFYGDYEDEYGALEEAKNLIDSELVQK